VTAIAFRPAAPSDIPSIVESWVESYRNSYSAGVIPMHQYQRTMRDAIGWLLQERGGVEVTVACHPEGDIYGWIAVESGLVAPTRTRVREQGRWSWQNRMQPLPTVIHYVYVQSAFRRVGMLKRLLKAAHLDLAGEWICTAKTPTWSRVVHALAPHIDLRTRFNPLLARFPRQDAKEAVIEAR
jgi:hypothetical protein